MSEFFDREAFRIRLSNLPPKFLGTLVIRFGLRVQGYVSDYWQESAVPVAAEHIKNVGYALDLAKAIYDNSVAPNRTDPALARANAFGAAKAAELDHEFGTVANGASAFRAAKAAEVAVTAVTAVTDAADLDVEVLAAEVEGFGRLEIEVRKEVLSDLAGLEKIATNESNTQFGVSWNKNGPLGVFTEFGHSRKPDGNSVKLVGGTGSLELPIWDDGTGLIVEFEVPDEMSDELVTELAAEVADGVDDLYQALGGRGLKIDDIQVEETADVATPFGGGGQ